MLFVASFLPVVLYLLAAWSVDRMSLVKARSVAVMLLCGMVAALACYFLFCSSLFTHHNSPIAHPLVEEMAKGVPLLVVACRKQIAFFIDSVICGAAVGAGFSLLENVLYLLMGEHMALGTAMYRGLEVSLIHMGASAAVAAALMFIVRQIERRHSRLDVKAKDIVVPMLILVAAVALHVVHNVVHFTPLLQTVAVLSGMALLLLFTYQWDAHQIDRWIDRGMNRQMEILRQVDDGAWGNVSDDVREYVVLHSRLAVAAKGRLMAREAGLDYPLDAERKAAIVADHDRYRQLARRLSPAARLSIRPVLKFYPADHKALDDLLSDCRR